MILQGNSFRLALRDESVHCIATSPPYWGLRNYGLEPMVFGGRDDCRHVWVMGIHNPNPHGDNGTTNSGLEGGKSSQVQTRIGEIESAFCQLCGAWLGSYGLEPALSLYVQHSVEVARECKRVLRPDGVMWWNLGDSYATSKNGRSAADGKAIGNDDRTFRDKPFSTAGEVRAKNLCMIPQRVALALQADGWIIRSAPPWIKRNPLPESVKDRPGTAHEYIFMLVKSDRYFWDMTSVRKTGKEWPGQAGTFSRSNGKMTELAIPGQAKSSHRTRDDRCLPGRSLRTSDFFFDSLDSYIAHLQDIRDNGGLMLEADGSPAAFVVNPKGYSVTVKSDKEIGRYAHSYDTIDTVSPDCPIHSHLLGSQKFDALEYNEQSNQNQTGIIDTDSHHAQVSFFGPSSKMPPGQADIYDDQCNRLAQSTLHAQTPENTADYKNEVDPLGHTSDAENQTRTSHKLESGETEDYKMGSSLCGYSEIATVHNTQSHKMDRDPLTISEDNVSAQTTSHTADISESRETGGHTSHIRESNTLEVSVLDEQDSNVSGQTTYHNEDKLKFPYSNCTCKLKKVKTDHYATWPIELVSPMIRSSTSDRGVCPKCGKQWMRMVNKTLVPRNDAAKKFVIDARDLDADTNDQGSNRQKDGHKSGHYYEVETTGWRPSCDCIRKVAPNYGMQGGELLELADEIAREYAPIPAIILDPFAGSGSTGQAANELGRRFIGVDLNPSYLALNALPRSENGTSQAAIEQLPMFFTGKAPKNEQ